MKWIRIPKEKCKQPDGEYTGWKPLLAEEGGHQCVYCAIGEASWGGIRNFHVEHFRPKSLFRSLENDFHNLYYACCVCNTFKGDDWPGEPDEELGSPGYVDPSLRDLGEIFAVDTSGVVVAESVTGRYMVARLYLNRPQLILERREAALCARFEDVAVEIDSLVAELRGRRDAISSQLLADAATILNGISRDLRERLRVVPYRDSDLRRGT